MADEVVLHVGLMKSGTTFLQGRLGANRDVLAEQGVLFPGPAWARQVRAVSDLAGRRNSVDGAWAEMAEEIRAHPGRVLISMEYLSTLKPDQIARVRADVAGATVKAVVTIRDLGRSVPAMWQEGMQNNQAWPWRDYLRAVEKREGPGKMFWRQQSGDVVVERWAAGVGVDNVTVVTVPPPGAPPELLWERFCQTVGITGADWAEGPRANKSLGVSSALMMGLLNSHFEDVDKETYNRQVKSLGKHVLPERRSREDSIGFAVPAWVHEVSAAAVARIRDSGVRVVGDLSELTPHDVPGVDPDDVPIEDVLEAAVDTLARVLRRPPKRQGKAARARRA